MHRARPGERGGGSYGRRAVATAKWAAMQISGDGKGLNLSARVIRRTRSYTRYTEQNPVAFSVVSVLRTNVLHEYRVPELLSLGSLPGLLPQTVHPQPAYCYWSHHLLADGAPEFSPRAIAPGELELLLSGLLALPSFNGLVGGVAIASPPSRPIADAHIYSTALVVAYRIVCIHRDRYG